MKTAGYSFALMLVILLCTCFYGCEISGRIAPDNRDDATQALCEYRWVDQFSDWDESYTEQTFTFNPDQTGYETYTTYVHGIPDRDEEYRFRWFWTSDSFSNIDLRYDDNTRGFMDRIFIGGDFLTCYLNGNYREFRAYD